MATYKLIQDIEAEDHILGPLTLRQFIFALIACFFGYLCFIVATKGVAFLLVLFAPPALFFGFFAFPFGKDQPTEVWFLAKLRFWFLPRKRIWDQSGVKELVTITVPKKVEQVLTDGLSQTEVKSRLQALANTIDSRGWAIKNVSVYAPPVVVGDGGSDRLIDLNSFPHEVPAYDAPASDDILDTSSPIAQQVDAMVNQAVQAHHQKLVDELNSPAPVASAAPAVQATTPAAMPTIPASNNWFMGSAAPAAAPAGYTYTPPPAAPEVPAADVANEEQLAKELKSRSKSQGTAYGNLRTLRPLGDAPPVPPTPPATRAAATPTPSDPAILALAGNDDLNVETLARQAKKAKGDDSNEVVISLR